MQFREDHGGFDLFIFNEMLYDYIKGYDLEWDDPLFLEELLDAAYADLKVHERIENYEECHKIKNFMQWACEEF